MYDNSFKDDLLIGQRAERIVFDTFTTLTTGYTFENVADKPEYYYKGDIIATNSTTGKITMIEVKNDSRTGESRNILCEELIASTESGFRDGNFYNDYEIYCVVCEDTREIIVMDFAILKQIYKQGQYVEIPHYHSTTYAFLLPIGTIERNGGLIKIINY